MKVTFFSSFWMKWKCTKSCNYCVKPLLIHHKSMTLFISEFLFTCLIRQKWTCLAEQYFVYSTPKSLEVFLIVLLHRIFIIKKVWKLSAPEIIITCNNHMELICWKYSSHNEFVPRPSCRIFHYLSITLYVTPYHKTCHQSPEQFLTYSPIII